LFWNEF
jgi:hypothetical protein